MANEHLKQLSDSDFESTISKGVTLVDFYADWCRPCQMIGPIVEQLATEFSGKAIIGKLNIDENQVTTSNFQVFSIPTVILFKDGKEVQRVVGVRGINDLRDLITANI